MRQNDLKLIEWIESFAERNGYVVLDRGIHGPWLFDIKIIEPSTMHTLSIIRLNYHRERYECATTDMKHNRVDEPVNLIYVEDVKKWCMDNKDFLDK